MKKLMMFSVLTALLLIIVGCSDEKSSKNQAESETKGNQAEVKEQENEEKDKGDEEIADFTLLDSQNQFGGESFTDLEIGKTQETEIFQSNGYLYVYTSVEEDELVSIADLENEKWIVKDKLLNDNLPNKVSNDIASEWNIIRVKNYNDETQTHFKINKDGDSEDTLYKESVGGSKEEPLLVHSNNETGYTYFVFEGKSDNTIAASKMNTETKEETSVGKAGFDTPDLVAFHLQKENLLLLQEDLLKDYYQVYDLEKGSLLYDENGKELEMGVKDMEGELKVLTEGKDGTLWTHSGLNTSNNSITFSLYGINEGTQPVEQSALNVKVGLEPNNEFGRHMKVIPYPKKDKFYVFQISNFNGKASLMAETFKLTQTK
ncbi:hypothetical protein MZM54_05310 [[Brevibacterium] frigoritolerans]|nr:hypothetical protein [Peribacillus frigoritolerans]